jgi:hypothetical protein
VLIGGSVRYGDKHSALLVDPAAKLTEIRVDGTPKVLDSRIAARLAQAGASETGLELPRFAWRAA